jgi:hypothetical protein
LFERLGVEFMKRMSSQIMILKSLFWILWVFSSSGFRV